MFKQIWNEGNYGQDCGTMHQGSRALPELSAAQHWQRSFLPLKSLRAEHPWDHIAVDCAVNLPESTWGNKHILILVDVASRFVLTVPLKSIDMDHLAEKLYLILCAFGPPKIMQSDNGTEFVNQLV